MGTKGRYHSQKISEVPWSDIDIFICPDCGVQDSFYIIRFMPRMPSKIKSTFADNEQRRASDGLLLRISSWKRLNAVYFLI